MDAHGDPRRSCDSVTNRVLVAFYLSVTVIHAPVTPRTPLACPIIGRRDGEGEGHAAGGRHPVLPASISAPVRLTAGASTVRSRGLG